MHKITRTVYTNGSKSTGIKPVSVRLRPSANFKPSHFQRLEQRARLSVVNTVGRPPRDVADYPELFQQIIKNKKASGIKDLSDRTGVSYGTLQSYIDPKRTHSQLKVIKQHADALGIDVETLIKFLLSKSD